MENIAKDCNVITSSEIDANLGEAEKNKLTEEQEATGEACETQRRLNAIEHDCEPASVQRGQAAAGDCSQTPCPIAAVPELQQQHQSIIKSDSDENSRASAVRILFSHNQDQRRRSLDQQTANLTDQAATAATAPTATEQSSRPNLSAAHRILLRQRSVPSIVNANRRLIERQIEEIQSNDGRRWNFDFRNCRPLAVSGHRYVYDLNQQINAPQRDQCRPASEQPSDTCNRVSCNVADTNNDTNNNNTNNSDENSTDSLVMGNVKGNEH